MNAEIRKKIHKKFQKLSMARHCPSLDGGHSLLLGFRHLRERRLREEEARGREEPDLHREPVIQIATHDPILSGKLATDTQVEGCTSSAQTGRRESGNSLRKTRRSKGRAYPPDRHRCRMRGIVSSVGHRLPTPVSSLNDHS